MLAADSSSSPSPPAAATSHDHSNDQQAAPTPSFASLLGPTVPNDPASFAGALAGSTPQGNMPFSPPMHRHITNDSGDESTRRSPARAQLRLSVGVGGNGGGGQSSVEMHDTPASSSTDTLLHHVQPRTSSSSSSTTSPHHLHPPLSGASAAKASRQNWKAFDQGMRFGCMIMLLFWVMWDCIVDSRLRPADQDLWVQLILPVYRGCGCLLLLGWCTGFSLFMWERFRINYPYLLEVDARSFLRAGDLLQSCCNATILFLANFLAYYKIMRGDFPSFVQAGWFPVAYLAWLVWRIVPWGWVLHGRVPRSAAVWRALGNVALTPCGRVTFMTGYLGDIWTSMVKVSVDMAYAACLVASADWMVDIESLPFIAALIIPTSDGSPEGDAAVAGAIATNAGNFGKLDTCFQSGFFKHGLIPLLSAVPLWVRFMQCLKRYVNTQKRWPHIGNACKYALAHSVVLFGVYNAHVLQAGGPTSGIKAAWILVMVGSTLFTFGWDVFMDWGLGNLKHGGLREELMFPHKGVYYAAIVIDLFARFAWTLTLVPQGEDAPFPPDFMLYLQPMLAAFEILRRTMWGMFRLEWEHISTQHYHRVPDAHLAATSPPSATGAGEMSGYRVIAEVSVLVIVVLTIGTTAALTAN